MLSVKATNRFLIERYISRGESMQDKSLFELTIVSNLSIEPFLVPSVNRIFEQNGIRIRIAAVNYDAYCSTESLQRFSESNTIVVLLNFENTYPGLLNEDSLTDVSTIVDFELEKAGKTIKITGKIFTTT